MSEINAGRQQVERMAAAMEREAAQLSRAAQEQRKIAATIQTAHAERVRKKTEEAKQYQQPRGGAKRGNRGQTRHGEVTRATTVSTDAPAAQIGALELSRWESGAPLTPQRSKRAAVRKPVKSRKPGAASMPSKRRSLKKRQPSAAEELDPRLQVPRPQSAPEWRKEAQAAGRRPDGGTDGRRATSATPHRRPLRRQRHSLAAPIDWSPSPRPNAPRGSPERYGMDLAGLSHTARLAKFLGPAGLSAAYLNDPTFKSKPIKRIRYKPRPPRRPPPPGISRALYQPKRSHRRPMATRHLMSSRPGRQAPRPKRRRGRSRAAKAGAKRRSGKKPASRSPGRRRKSGSVSRPASASSQSKAPSGTSGPPSAKKSSKRRKRKLAEQRRARRAAARWEEAARRHARELLYVKMKSAPPVSLRPLPIPDFDWRALFASESEGSVGDEQPESGEDHGGTPSESESSPSSSSSSSSSSSESVDDDGFGGSVPWEEQLGWFSWATKSAPPPSDGAAPIDRLYEASARKKMAQRRKSGMERGDSEYDSSESEAPGKPIHSAPPDPAAKKPQSLFRSGTFDVAMRTMGVLDAELRLIRRSRTEARLRRAEVWERRQAKAVMLSKAANDERRAAEAAVAAERAREAAERERMAVADAESERAKHRPYRPWRPPISNRMFLDGEWIEVDDIYSGPASGAPGSTSGTGDPADAAHDATTAEQAAEEYRMQWYELHPRTAAADGYATAVVETAEPAVDEEGAAGETQWTEEVDDEGNAYYYNWQTGESLWQRPRELLVSMRRAAAAAAFRTEAEGAPEAVADAGAEAGGAEDEWAEYLDEASGLTYWFNAVTGETTWTKPSADGTAGDGEEREFATELLDENDPAAWETVTADDGSIYYYNTVTGVSQWDEPQALQAKLRAAAAFSSAAPTEESNVADDPDDWQSVHDDEGNDYYFNAKTGESAWQRPGLLGKVLAASRATKALQWWRAEDEHGNEYFYNEAGETSWTDPTESAEAPRVENEDGDDRAAPSLFVDTKAATDALGSPTGSGFASSRVTTEHGTDGESTSDVASGVSSDGEARESAAAASDSEHSVGERASLDGDKASSVHDRASHDDDRASSDDDRASSDDDDRASSDDDRASSDDDRASVDDDRVSSDDDRASRDDDRASSDDDRASNDGDRASRDGDSDSEEREGDGRVDGASERESREERSNVDESVSNGEHHDGGGAPGTEPAQRQQSPPAAAGGVSNEAPSPRLETASVSSHSSAAESAAEDDAEAAGAMRMFRSPIGESRSVSPARAARHSEPAWATPVLSGDEHSDTLTSKARGGGDWAAAARDAYSPLREGVERPMVGHLAAAAARRRPVSAKPRATVVRVAATTRPGSAPPGRRAVRVPRAVRRPTSAVLGRREAEIKALSAARRFAQSKKGRRLARREARRRAKAMKLEKIVPKRGFSAVSQKRRVARAEQVARRMQAIWRGKMARRVHFVNVRSATVVQSAWRRRQAVKHVQHVRRRHAATRIQCMHRRRKARFTAAQMARAAMLLTLAGLRWRRRRRATAATRIQAVTRGSLLRLSLLRKRAATRMQSVVRGRAARAEVTELRRNTRAAAIQRVWRGAVARRNFHDAVSALLCLQSAGRGLIGRTDALARAHELTEAETRRTEEEQVAVHRADGVAADLVAERLSRIAAKVKVWQRARKFRKVLQQCRARANEVLARHAAEADAATPGAEACAVVVVALVFGAIDVEHEHCLDYQQLRMLAQELAAPVLDIELVNELEGKEREWDLHRGVRSKDAAFRYDAAVTSVSSSAVAAVAARADGASGDDDGELKFRTGLELHEVVTFLRARGYLELVGRSVAAAVARGARRPVPATKPLGDSGRGSSAPSRGNHVDRPRAGGSPMTMLRSSRRLKVAPHDPGTDVESASEDETPRRGSGSSHPGPASSPRTAWEDAGADGVRGDSVARLLDIATFGTEAVAGLMVDSDSDDDAEEEDLVEEAQTPAGRALLDLEGEQLRRTLKRQRRKRNPDRYYRGSTRSDYAGSDHPLVLERLSSEGELRRKQSGHTLLRRAGRVKSAAGLSHWALAERSLTFQARCEARLVARERFREEHAPMVTCNFCARTFGHLRARREHVAAAAADGENLACIELVEVRGRAEPLAVQVRRGAVLVLGAAPDYVTEVDIYQPCMTAEGDAIPDLNGVVDATDAFDWAEHELERASAGSTGAASGDSALPPRFVEPAARRGWSAELRARYLRLDQGENAATCFLAHRREAAGMPPSHFEWGPAVEPSPPEDDEGDEP